ncbi:histone deacetylase complex subunit SAP18 [Lepeophtheirus salmonis]|uniref:18 kDa Sin3-associated polypeptide n=1 Tax=Lepeophtheirus salmonis TaxID=72036 RepID=C1BV10_LEPSM|nr:histone deacetylase complex subunit SAP18-like [Lepeophtheirus salmonis]ACO12863.1 Histone deacetylase complex subunit SAP18 [Lepeophtheirus salmonis]ADD38476.1 Histone deacetylase complex subunit SAP18 [Lepeophtheirus salmonis]
MNSTIEKRNGSGKAMESVNREKVCPLLLRVFCSTSRHNPLTEYSRGKVPANELQIYTWMDATLKELTSLVREVNPDARRKGTFFDFALVFPNLSSRGNMSGSGYMSRDIGTTVSGQKGPDDSKTLSQCRFTIGDYLDIAITPPAIVDRNNFGGRRNNDRFNDKGGRHRPY